MPQWRFDEVTAGITPQITFLSNSRKKEVYEIGKYLTHINTTVIRFDNPSGGGSVILEVKNGKKCSIDFYLCTIPYERVLDAARSSVRHNWGGGCSHIGKGKTDNNRIFSSDEFTSNNLLDLEKTINCIRDIISLSDDAAEIIIDSIKTQFTQQINRMEELTRLVVSSPAGGEYVKNHYTSHDTETMKEWIEHLIHTERFDEAMALCEPVSLRTNDAYINRTYAELLEKSGSTDNNKKFTHAYKAFENTNQDRDLVTALKYLDKVADDVQPDEVYVRLSHSRMSDILLNMAGRIRDLKKLQHEAPKFVLQGAQFRQFSSPERKSPAPVISEDNHVLSLTKY